MSTKLADDESIDNNQRRRCGLDGCANDAVATFNHPSRGPDFPACEYHAKHVEELPDSRWQPSGVDLTCRRVEAVPLEVYQR